MEQSNFHDYRLLRMADTPEIEVEILAPTRADGRGRARTPPIAPAVANALFALTERRLRRLPFDVSLST